MNWDDLQMVQESAAYKETPRNMNIHNAYIHQQSLTKLNFVSKVVGPVVIETELNNAF
jgi:hypothetical protein